MPFMHAISLENMQVSSYSGLSLEDTHVVMMLKQTPMHNFLNNSIAGPSFKNLRDDLLTKWPRMSEVCLH